jgi:regulator of PEP synthase PpsR (kinase-PPPase family)
LSPQPVYIISDRSGLTAETLSHTLLSQFPDSDFKQVAMPFIDSPEKMQRMISTINQAAAESKVQPLVFATFVDEELVRMLSRADAEIFDLFDPFISRIEKALGQASSHEPGQAHGMSNISQYKQRINAVNYALHCDDGLHGNDYDSATMILVGVSRSGKTPTCLYLALHFGFHAANYPLTEEDFEKAALPDSIIKNRQKVFGLTIDPFRLHQIRSERLPDSNYASLSQCRKDVQAARQIFTKYRIPFCDSTAYSVEELGSTIKHQMELESDLY